MTPAQFSHQGLTSWVFRNNIIANLARWGVQQSPFIMPDNLELCLTKADEWLQANVEFPTAGMAEFTEPALRDVVERMIEAVPEIRDWNLSKREKDAGIKVDDEGRGFGVSSRYHGPAQANDFIDLGALSRNITYGCLIENYIPTPIAANA